MTTSDVSVVIPNYNHSRYLSDAVRSVLAQTIRPVEVIIVDDGSTDGCSEVISSFGDGVRYVRQDNQGLAAARNTGIRLARGTFIGLLDADDRWRPDFLSIMTGLAAREPTAAAYYCGAQTMDENGHLLPQRLGGPSVEPALLRNKLLRASFIIPSTVLLRRQAVVDAGMFDESLRSVEDLDLWLRVSECAQIVGSNACGSDYRVHQDSLSGNVSLMRASFRQVIEKHFGPESAPKTGWADKKRRAYGGLYRFEALTSVRGARDWATAASAIQNGLQADPSLAEDLDLFYDLALGSQPTGYRGTREHLDFDGASAGVELLLTVVRAGLGQRPVVRVAQRTAYKALGLVAYNTGHYRDCRRYLLKALRQHPSVWLDRLVIGDLLKSVIRQRWPPDSQTRVSRHW
jgi:glycosyltransferase involved in cell wall biosynthesis